MTTRAYIEDPIVKELNAIMTEMTIKKGYKRYSCSEAIEYLLAQNKELKNEVSNLKELLGDYKE